MTRDQLKERGVEEDAVRYELFTTGDPTEPRGHRGRPVEIDPKGENRTIEFSLDGLSSSVETPVAANESVLNAALRVRPDTPFACAGGVCGTCRAKVVTGTFEMDENYALEADEVEAGYVLTCQTRPTSEKLTVDYDPRAITLDQLSRLVDAAGYELVLPEEDKSVTMPIRGMTCAAPSSWSR